MPYIAALMERKVNKIISASSKQTLPPTAERLLGAFWCFSSHPHRQNCNYGMLPSVCLYGSKPINECPLESSWLLMGRTPLLPPILSSPHEPKDVNLTL